MHLLAVLRNSTQLSSFFSALNVGRRRVIATVGSQYQHQKRTFIQLPDSVKKALGDPDNLIPDGKDRKKPGTVPDYAPEGLKKDLKELGLDGIEDLDALEEKNIQFFNDTGMVPPDGSGTFDKPILIPSRKPNRVCGYIDPVTHATFWFTIQNDGNVYYIQDLGLFFKVLPIPDDASAAH